MDRRHFKFREHMFSHAEEEQDHWKRIIEDLPFTPHQWAIAEHAAKMSLHFYRAMYNEVAKNT